MISNDNDLSGDLARAREQARLSEQVRCLQLGHFVRAELRRHFLSERERLIAEAILDLSLFYGHASALIPKLETFSDLTGIPRSHVHGALKALVEMRIVRMEQRDRCVCYSLNGDSDGWKVKVRVAAQTIQRARELVIELSASTRPLGDAGNGACSNFKVAEVAVLNGAVVTDSVTVTEGETLMARARAVLARAAANDQEC